MLKFADNNIKLCKYGDIEIPKIYYGNDLIFETGGNALEFLKAIITDFAHPTSVSKVLPKLEEIYNPSIYTKIYCGYYDKGLVIMLFEDEIDAFMSQDTNGILGLYSNKYSQISNPTFQPFYSICILNSTYAGSYEICKIKPANVWDKFGKFFGRDTGGPGYSITELIKSDSITSFTAHLRTPTSYYSNIEFDYRSGSSGSFKVYSPNKEF